jgi:O-antigen ligase
MTRFGDGSRRVAAALGAALFLIVLASLSNVPGVPRLVFIELAALVVLAGLRPDHALAALAVTTPIAVWIGRQWHSSAAWAEAGAVAFCAGYCLRRALARRSDDPPDRLDAPILVTSAVVIASLVAQILIDDWRFGHVATLTGLQEIATGWYFLMGSNADPIDAAMRLLESLLLLRAVTTITRATPEIGARLIAWSVIGAAMAASLNLLRVWQGATRLDAPLTSFVRLLMHARFNESYGDVNAAGSYFMLTLLAAAGLALAKSRVWVVAMVLVGSSLWITSSRTALMVAALALLLPAGALAMRIHVVRRRRMAIAGAAVVLAIAAGTAAYAIPQRGNQQSVVAATRVRLELARTSLRMTASSPAFGVGVGRYYSRSGEFSSPELLQLFPPAVHENAHNNFLQVLAELGIVGFAAILWLLWTAGRLTASMLAADLRDPLRWGLATGLLAFVLSWLGGHPLLLDEPAFTFWMLLGVTCGWGAQHMSLTPLRPGSTTWLVGVLIVLIAASVPVQVMHERADFNLEHRGIGVSPWQPAVDGIRYRLAGVSSSVFVPSEAQMIVVPLRAADPHTDLRVAVRLDGQAADVIAIGRDRWQQLRLRLPQERHPPRFRRLELRVEDPPAGAENLLMIGKAEPR